jgi:hypothetical protein
MQDFLHWALLKLLLLLFLQHGPPRRMLPGMQLPVVLRGRAGSCRLPQLEGSRVLPVLLVLHGTTGFK